MKVVSYYQMTVVYKVKSRQIYDERKDAVSYAMPKLIAWWQALKLWHKLYHAEMVIQGIKSSIDDLATRQKNQAWFLALFSERIDMPTKDIGPNLTLLMLDYSGPITMVLLPFNDSV